MNPLASLSCEACRAGSPLATEQERATFLPHIPDWSIRIVDGVERLERTFVFPDFARALEFTNRVGALAEEEGHHPAILTEWGRTTVGWWTHAIRGLHRNDFVLAARTDGLLAEG